MVDCLETPVNFREVLFRFDLERISLSQSQLGYFTDLETLRNVRLVLGDNLQPSVSMSEKNNTAISIFKPSLTSC